MIVFMGTDDFAVPILESLIENNYDISLVVCQPDSYVGRKRVLTVPPVKEVALKHNIEVFQPIKLRNEYQYIIDVGPSLIITASYGQILPKKLLDEVRAINIHGSLLPKYRGGAPIQYALFNADEKTGITLMEMIFKMDAGDMIAKEEIGISEDDNYYTLKSKLSNLGSQMLIKWLDKILVKDYKAIKQDESEVTFAYNLTAEDEILNFNLPSRLVLGRIRGLTPHIGAKIMIENQSVKVYKAVKSDIIFNTEPGIVHLIGKRMYITTIDGAIEILEIQREGRKILSVSDFLNGQNIFTHLQKIN